MPARPALFSSAMAPCAPSRATRTTASGFAAFTAAAACCAWPGVNSSSATASSAGLLGRASDGSGDVLAVVALLVQHRQGPGAAVFDQFGQDGRLGGVGRRGAEIVAAALVVAERAGGVGRRDDGHFGVGKHVDGGRGTAGIGRTDHDVGLGGHERFGLGSGVRADGFRQQLHRFAFVAAGSVDVLDGKLCRRELGGVEEVLPPRVVQDQADAQGAVTAGVGAGHAGTARGPQA